jgi:phospholipid N-methyltransferase
LPFASLPKEVSQNIFEEIKLHLKKNGKFLQFQYSLFSRKDFNKLFDDKPAIDFVLLNIPPAFIYEIKNNI